MRVREGLPQLSDATFITDGGIETTLIFHQGLELPYFASFVLLDDEEGVRALEEYFRPYVAIARDASVGIALDTPTWRANPDSGERLGYSPDARRRTGGPRSSSRAASARAATATRWARR
jgi:homocysteine S-methyltransferase